MASVALVFAGPGTLRAAGSGTTQQDAGLSCKAILDAGLSSGDGLYWIDPNGGDRADAFQAYCDMTTDGGGWTLGVNSFIGQEPSTTDMTSNTGVVAFTRGHTRDLTNLAINHDAQIRYVLSEFTTPRSFHAKFTGRYHNPLPPFSAWTPLPGHTPGTESMMASHFGMHWSTPYSDRDGSTAACASVFGNVPWHYNNCWTSIPTNQADGSVQGPMTLFGTQPLFRFSIFVREVSTIAVPPAHVAPSFRAAVNLPVGTGPVDMAIGDFDDDGRSDVVTANDGGVTVRYANGRVFQHLGLPSIRAIATGHFNGDDRLDFVVGHSVVIETFISTGAGFVPSAGQVTCDASNIVTADFDKNGTTDAAVSCTHGAVTILQGDGDGSLSEVKWLPTSVSTHSLALADFNGDTWIDVVVTGGSSGCFDVLLGGPAFTLTSNFQCSGTLMGPVAVGDLDGDGRLDLAVGATTQINSLRNVDGVHFSTMALSAVDSVVDLALADVDANGHLDAVVAHNAPKVGVALGTGTGAFNLGGFRNSISSVPSRVAAGDVNGDGEPDIVTADTATDSISVLYNSFDPNQAPIASDGTLTVPEGMSASGRLSGSDPEGASLTFALASTGIKGTASLIDASTGAYSYAANVGASGTDTFTFTVSDGNSSSAATITVTVTPRHTPQIIWVTPAPIVYGTPLGAAQLNATVEPGVTGTFTYAPAAGTVLGAGPAQTLSFTFTPDDTTHYMPTSGTVAIDVLKAPLTVKAADASIVFGQPLPRFSVTFHGFVNGEGPASLGGTLAFTGPSSTNAGSYPITPGGLTSANYALGFEPGTLTIARVPSQTATLTTQGTVSVLQPFKLTGSVARAIVGVGHPTGQVRFFDNGIPIGTADIVNVDYAVLTMSLAVPGPHVFTATYLGDGNFAPSTSEPQLVTVRPLAASTFTLAFATNSPTALGQRATFAAWVMALGGTATPTGTVAFFDGVTELGTAVLSGGVATFSTTALAAGPHVIIAVYRGAGVHASSVSSPTAHNVYSGTPPLPAAMTLAGAATPTAVGQPVTFTVTITPASGVPTGTVLFLVNNMLLGKATLSSAGGAFHAAVTTTALPVGVHVISAVYEGDGVFGASAAGPVLHQVQ